MADYRSLGSVIGRIREDSRFGVSLVVLALAFLATGYAVGSVLAGEPVGSQLWLVPAFAGCLVTWLALSASGDGS